MSLKFPLQWICGLYYHPANLCQPPRHQPTVSLVQLHIHVKANDRTLSNQFFLGCSNHSHIIPLNPFILRSSTVLATLDTTHQSLSTPTHTHPNNHNPSSQRQHKRPRTIPPTPYVPETVPETCPAITVPAYLPVVLFRRHDVSEGLSSRGGVAHTFDDTV